MEMTRAGKGEFLGVINGAGLAAPTRGIIFGLPAKKFKKSPIFAPAFQRSKTVMRKLLYAIRPGLNSCLKLYKD